MDSSNLRNQLDQVKEGTGDQEENDDQTVENETDPEPTETKNKETATTDTETTDPEDTTDEIGPAFTAKASEKLSIYPSEDNARFIKVLCNSVENDLIALGHDDFEIREAHDAMVRFAHEHPREVTQLVLKARDLDPDAVEDLP